MKLPATIENLRFFLQFVSECAGKRGFTQSRLNEIELAVEEALVNIIRYAYPQKAGHIDLRCHTLGESGFIITIEDEGIPFDLLSLPDPTLSADISQRKIGGLGIFLIRKMANDVQYHRDGNRNILTLVLLPERCSLPHQNSHTSVQP